LSARETGADDYYSHMGIIADFGMVGLGWGETLFPKEALENYYNLYNIFDNKLLFYYHFCNYLKISNTFFIFHLRWPLHFFLLHFYAKPNICFFIISSKYFESTPPFGLSSVRIKTLSSSSLASVKTTKPSSKYPCFFLSHFSR